MRASIVKILENAKKQISQNIDSEKIKASGRTQKSLRVEDRGGSIVLLSDGTGAPFETLQFGRPAGKVPYNMQDIILQWMKVKDIGAEAIPYKTDRPHKYTPIQRGLMHKAYFISKKIREEGTNRHKTHNTNVYSGVLKKTTQEIKNQILGEIKTQINVKI